MLGSACIPQLLGLGESGIGFGCLSEGFKSNAFVVPDLGIVGISPDGFVVALDGIIVLVRGIEIIDKAGY